MHHACDRHFARGELAGALATPPAPASNAQRARAAVRAHRRLILGVALILSACSDSDCDPIAEACDVAQQSEIAPLLLASTITLCSSATEAADDAMCSAVLDECLVECALARPPAREASLTGCWTDGSHHLCMGEGFGPSAHGYELSPSPVPGEPSFQGEFEHHGDDNLPRLVTLYNYVVDDQGTVAFGCLELLLRKDDLFATEIRPQPEMCTTANSRPLGPLTTRWRRAGPRAR